MGIVLLGKSRDELQGVAESLGQPRFRGDQIAQWVYRRNARTIMDMSNLPVSLRTALDETAEIGRSSVASKVDSEDGTIKLLLELRDGQRIECVLLPYEDRVSVCISTQVGCPASCAFCATGLGGFCRNLDAGEILDQVLTLQQFIERRISHVVYMGMGEPLLNYANVLRSIELLTGEVGISSRHITVSTVGIIPQILELAKLKLPITLAISLHAVDDEQRKRLIPISARYRISDLVSACREYVNTTRRKVTIEYMLLSGVNDRESDALRLASLLKGMMVNVNLIPYNGVEGLDFRRPSNVRIKAFRSVLERGGISVTQRLERGHSIDAACGQLRKRIGKNSKTA